MLKNKLHSMLLAPVLGCFCTALAAAAGPGLAGRGPSIPSPAQVAIIAALGLVGFGIAAFIIVLIVKAFKKAKGKQADNSGSVNE